MRGLRTILINGELTVRKWLSLRNNSIGWGDITIPKLKKFITSCTHVQRAMGEALFWAENKLEELKQENTKKRK